MADALGSGPSSFTGVRVQLPPSAPSFSPMRVWHNGCAPAFQAGYRGSTPLTRSKRIGGIAERSKAADCKSALSEFDGSNPSPTTIFDLTVLVAVFLCLNSRTSSVKHPDRYASWVASQTQVGRDGSHFGSLSGSQTGSQARLSESQYTPGF